MSVLNEHPIVCFEVDESLSDASLAKSVIITGRAEIISEPKRMIPYLQMHIDKYRVPRSFGEYASMDNRKEKALKKSLEGTDSRLPTWGDKHHQLPRRKA